MRREYKEKLPVVLLILVLGFAAVHLNTLGVRGEEPDTMEDPEIINVNILDEEDTEEDGDNDQEDWEDDFEIYDETWSDPAGLDIDPEGLQSSQEEHIKIEALDTAISYLEKGGKNPLYNDDARVKITLRDSHSGIKAVNYSVTAEYDGAKNREYFATVSEDGEAGGGWTVTEKNEDLVTEMTKTITVSHNSNDIVIRVELTDNAGNISEKDFSLSIDKDAPIIAVSFSPYDQGASPGREGCFNSDRTMTVTVLERNFDPEMVNFISTENGERIYIPASFEVGIQSDSNGIQFFSYTMNHTFSAQDSDFTFEMWAEDKASNRTDDEQVNYGSAGEKRLAKSFSIDKLKPDITFEIHGERGASEGFFSSAVTAVVRISERNFDPEGYEIQISEYDSATGEAKAEGLKKSEASEGEGIYSYTYTFDGESRYEISSIKAADKAGNESVFEPGKEEGEFTVDLKEPEIKFFTGPDMEQALDKTASRDRVTPFVMVEDTNYERLQWRIYGNRRGEIDNSEFDLITDEGPKGISLAFSDFKMEEDIDDIYEIKVSATDKAGREKEDSAVFSVNRFGSTFMIDDVTKDLNDRYFINQEQEVRIIEINAVPLLRDESDKPRVTLVRNGHSSVLTEGEDYELREAKPGTREDDEPESSVWATNSHWYEYSYHLKKSNFEEEGRYLVDILTKDRTENKQTNLSSAHRTNFFVSEGSEAPAYNTRENDRYVVADKGYMADAPVEFIIDKTPPELSMSEFQGNAYNQSSLDFTISCNDEVKLEKVSCILDGVEEEISAEEFAAGGGLVTRTLKAKDKEQLISLVATDAAGNVSYYPKEGEHLGVPENAAGVKVLVTTNSPEHLVHGTMLVILGAMAVVAVLQFFEHIRDIM